MKNVTSFILGIVLIVSPIACNFEDINIDPSRPSEVELKLLLPEAITQTAFNQGTHPIRVAGMLMQQLKGSGHFNANHLPEITFDDYWTMSLYAGSLRSAKLIADKAEAENAPHYAGIAKILLAIGYGNATSYFGDIPYSDALSGNGNLKPTFDTQEEVYEGVQTLLDEAIEHLSQPRSPAGPTTDDLIFGGDAEAWIKTAYALKVRYLMHTIERNFLVIDEILDIIPNKAFQSTDEQPGFAWGNTYNESNPMARFHIDRPSTIFIDEQFVQRMEAKADPRQALYFVWDNYHYNPFINGMDGQLVWTQFDSTIPLISLEELKFIEAEVEYRRGGDEAAKTALLAAVATNMAHLGVDGTDYIAALDAAYDAADNKCEVIINEAYTAYYGHAFHQTWANYRRTGYPNLIASPLSDNSLNPGGGIAQRYLYPLSEVELNSANLEAARSRQYGALLNIPVWAFQ